MMNSASVHIKEQALYRYGKEYTDGYLPDEVLDWSGLSDRKGDLTVIGNKKTFLSWYNDNGRSFSEIADAIEAQL